MTTNGVCIDRWYVMMIFSCLTRTVPGESGSALTANLTLSVNKTISRRPLKSLSFQECRIIIHIIDSVLTS